MLALALRSVVLFVLLALIVAVFGFAPQAEEACSACPASGPPCEATWKAPVIFAGRVTAFDVEPDATQGHRIRIRFAVTENFRGSSATEIELILPDSSCNPNFHVGQSWLVYATNRGAQPGWTTSLCSRTRLLSEAAEDLAYLRLPDSEKGTSRVMGQVLRQRFTLQGRTVARDVQPVRGVRVTVRGDRDTFHTTTDGAGRYEMPVTPGDSYAISFDPPEGLRIERQWTNRVQVDVYPACVAVDAYARDDGRISGRLVDARGKPVPNFPLTLRFSPDAAYGGLDLHLRTGADGRFEFLGVMPARYTLAPSSSLWQREHALPAVGPEAIDVAIAQRIDIGDIALAGDIRAVPLTIVVTRPDGSPAAGVRVIVRKAWGQLSDVLTDEQGRLELTVVAGPYDVIVNRSSRDLKGSFSELAREQILVQQPMSVRLRLARAR